ncbi:MAG: hypothetical protein QOH26_268, partial [Actinomycetota bacterium]|nr:hypothetical protein [Actinomycetota bacterium]
MIGGTRFVGRHLVDALLARGHDVTLFNRGQTNPELFPKAEKIKGDREGDLSSLDGRSWDAVIDTCGYVPRVVGASATALGGSVGRYVFISSVSAYSDFRHKGRREEDALAKLDDESTEEITGETYGALKALAENAVFDAVGDRALIVRPGLIVGPHDHTDRFSYWPHRMAAGGHVLAPGDGRWPVQVIDVRDLTEWIVLASERGVAGVFNATGPTFSFATLLAVSGEVTRAPAEVEWVDEGFLLREGVEPWSEMPLWIPSSDPDSVGFAAVDSGRAMEAGLRFRSIQETVKDTMGWMKQRDD